MQRLAFIAILFFAVALSAAERPRVVTSFLPLYCWTANVAGENATVENLLPARAEPHDYAFTPGDARRLGGAGLIVVNGLGLEPWLPKFLRGSPTSNDRVLAIGTGLGGQRILGDAARPNPHVWLDPQLAAYGVSNLALALQRIDPPRAAAYADNARMYLARLDRLDHDIQQSLAGITNRAIVTYHDAFPYFARRYGLEIAGLVEQVPDVNPTPKHLAQLSRMMRARGLRVIWVPVGGRTRLAERIAADLKVELVELDTLETGALSPSAYEERMRANAAVLQKHLK